MKLWDAVKRFDWLGSIVGGIVGTLLSVPVGQHYYAKSGKDLSDEATALVKNAKDNTDRLDAAVQSVRNEAKTLGTLNANMLSRVESVQVVAEDLHRLNGNMLTRVKGVQAEASTLRELNATMLSRVDSLRDQASELRKFNVIMLTGMERAGWVELARDAQGNITGWKAVQLAGGVNAGAKVSATLTVTPGSGATNPPSTLATARLRCGTDFMLTLQSSSAVSASSTSPMPTPPSRGQRGTLLRVSVS